MMAHDSVLRVWTWIIVILLMFCIGLTIFVISRQSGDPYATRRVLCIGILRNTANTARQDPQLLKDCAAAGVYP